ncbi:SAVED domain-containing protein [Roseateles sp. P5_D6]
MTAVAPPPVAASAPAGGTTGTSFSTTAAASSAPPDQFPPQRDAEMAALVLGQAAPRQLLVVANTFTVALYSRATAADAWSPLCSGDLGDATSAALKPCAPKRLWWASTDQAPWAVHVDQLQPVSAPKALIARWMKAADKETGREGGVTDAVYEEVTSLAAWRCQFSGCGKDLKTHGTGRVRMRSSYFAHIVAASPTGPRGCLVESRLLADNPTNFLLLCDECHRLIDKVAPGIYTTPVLRRMREESIAEVDRLLGALQHQVAEVIAIVGNIAGQPPQFSIQDAQEALWGRRLRTQSNSPKWFFYPGGQHHSPHQPDYWPSLFRTMRTDLPRLQGLLNGTSEGGAPRPRLAVFPLHCTSVLLLAGRVLGDMAGTSLFQPHRNVLDGRTRWAWPADAQPMQPAALTSPGSPTAPSSAPSKFTLTELHPHTASDDEACLVVALTSAISPARMPSGCATGDTLTLPTLLIGPELGKDCIQQPADLEALAVTVDAAMRRLQDEWGVKLVHLFVSAPATATLLVGQKMQARHQAAYVCHEAVGGPGSGYAPTIELTSTHVRELVSGQGQSIELQT